MGHLYIIYNYNKKLKNRNNLGIKHKETSGLLKDTEISETNQKLFLNFVNYCFSDGIGEHRAFKYLSTLKIVAESILTDLKTHQRLKPVCELSRL